MSKACNLIWKAGDGEDALKMVGAQASRLLQMATASIAGPVKITG